MDEVAFQRGTFIYREGDKPEAVFFVLTGEVEVLRTVDKRAVRLAIITRGNFFGETGVIRNLPRSITAKARTDVTAIRVPRNRFLDMVRTDQPVGLAVLRRLCQRLAHADSKPLPSWHPDDEIAPDAKISVRLLPGSALVASLIGTEGIDIRTFPFRVGRRLQPGEAPLKTTTELALTGSDMYQMSPAHFSLELVERRPAVRDLGSYLGTVVNGVRLAKFETSEVAMLQLGQNLVLAGGDDSPYSFAIIVNAS
ncbi:MAG: cyclic nucleotide-binding domain-containing protein [Candidatus Eiseniibacteriota bacterium]